MMSSGVRCSRCIVPESLPSVTLDDMGVCNHCRNYEKWVSEWDETAKKAEFEEMVRWSKALNRKYDCLIPLSGGKDSTYALYLCAKVYQLRCMCVTFDNGFMSDYAKHNIQNAVLATHADHVFYTIDRDLLLSLYKTFLMKAGDFCSVCMYGIRSAQNGVAKRLDIPLIVTGDGKRRAYLNPFPEVFQAGDRQFFSNVIKSEPIEKDIQPILPYRRSLDAARILRILSNLLKIKNHRLPRGMAIYDYFLPSREEAYQTIRKEMCWIAPQGESEHMDCLLHPLQTFLHHLKFPELSPVTLFHSGLIRQGIMTRDAAIDIDRNVLPTPQAPPVLTGFLNELGVSRNEFESSVSDWRKLDEFRSKKRDFVLMIYQKIAGL